MRVLLLIMLTRKREMATRADAFIALPGGFGTLEEVLEQLTARLLGLREKPIVLVDVDQFWQPLLALFDRLHRERLARPERTGACTVVDAAAAALAALDTTTVGPPGNVV